LHFRRLDSAPHEYSVEFTFDGRLVKAVAGQSVAAALLATGICHFRNSRDSGEPRGPYCLMGTCFECLVHIDGLGTCQACITPARNAMRVLST
jgi:predicted molibdopterin-dependent oxidoreductase YjgC